MADDDIVDDPSIPNESELWRRIAPPQWKPDSNHPRGFRPTSDMFNDDELSVVIATECTGGIDTLLAGHLGFGVAAFTAGEVRAFEWGVVRAPDTLLPGHAHVLGKKGRRARKTLAMSCRVLREPAAE